MNRTIRFAVSILLFSLLSACSPSQPQAVDPAEAQKMVFQAVTSSQSPETAASYTVLGSQAGYHGHVIAYWMCQPASPDNPAAVSQSGYAIVRSYDGHTGIQNQTQGGGGLPKADSLVEFSAFVEDNSDGKLAVVFGRILSPRVRSVEVMYADQKSLRWPAGSGGFLLFRSEPVDWTHLNVLGENDQVLKRYDLAQDTMTISEREEVQGIDFPATK